jgi:hypothetical protein
MEVEDLVERKRKTVKAERSNGSLNMTCPLTEDGCVFKIAALGLIHCTTRLLGAERL